MYTRTEAHRSALGYLITLAGKKKHFRIILARPTLITYRIDGTEITFRYTTGAWWHSVTDQPLEARTIVTLEQLTERIRPAIVAGHRKGTIHTADELFVITRISPVDIHFRICGEDVGFVFKDGYWQCVLSRYRLAKDIFASLRKLSIELGGAVLKGYQKHGKARAKKQLELPFSS